MAKYSDTIDKYKGFSYNFHNSFKSYYIYSNNKSNNEWSASEYNSGSLYLFNILAYTFSIVKLINFTL